MKKEDIPYLRVGTAILKRVLQPLSNGRSLETLIQRNQRQTEHNLVLIESAEMRYWVR